MDKNLAVPTVAVVCYYGLNQGDAFVQVVPFWSSADAVAFHESLPEKVREESFVEGTWSPSAFLEYAREAVD